MLEMWIAIKILLCIIAVESLVELITDSRLMKGARRLIKSSYRNISYTVAALPIGVRGDEAFILSAIKTILYFPYWWVKCGYCCSYIVSLCVVSIVDLKLEIVNSTLLNLAFQTVILGRLSNWLHDLLQVVLRGRVKYVDLTTHIVFDGEQDDAGTKSIQTGES